jgi:hypothetical protein
LSAPSPATIAGTLTDSERVRFYASSLAFAAVGFAVAMASQPMWTRAAGAGQVPGYMLAHGLDARGPFWFTVTLAVLPLIVAAAMRRVSAMLAGAETQPWARMTCWAACAGSVWLAVISPDVLYVIAPVVLFVPLAIVLRRFEARFTADDVVLLPAFIVVYFALLDLTDADGRLLLLAAVWLLFVLRLFRSNFAFAPLGIIPQATLLFGHRAWLNVLALAIVFVPPWFGRGSKRVLTFVAYPVFVYFLPLACSTWAAEGIPRINFFERGQSLIHASNMLHGARVYRDTVPMHGLIEDGGLDFLVMRFGGAHDIGSVVTVHDLVGQLNAPAMYAMTAAASASPPVALLAVLFVNCPNSLRCAFALLALAAMITAYRRQSPKLLGYAGALVALACLTSVDFGVYSLLALIVTALLMRPRGKAFGAAAIGIVAAAIPIALLFAALGILGPAISRTIALTRLAPAYNLGFFAAPKALADLRFFPDVLLAFLQRPSMAVGVWMLGVAVIAVGVAAGPSRKLGPLVILAVFVAATGLSYAERHHLYGIENGGYPLLFAGVAILLRDERLSAKVAGRIAAILLLITAGITADIAVFSAVRRQRQIDGASVTELRDVPPARHALFDKRDAEYVTTLNTYFAQNLGPSETFFDFTNRGLLFYLLDRRCPVPLNEVAAYEAVAAQEEVIRRIEQQPEVRYALIPPPNDGFTIDGVANRERAPLVWAYLQQHFRPAFEQGPVIVWKRQ